MDGLVSFLAWVGNAIARSSWHDPGSRYAARSGVDKLLQIHHGQFAVNRMTEDVLKVLDTGTLYVTNNRLLFDGAKKTTNLALKRVISFTVYADGLKIEKDSGNDQYFQFERFDPEMVGALFDGVLSKASGAAAEVVAPSLSSQRRAAVSAQDWAARGVCKSIDPEVPGAWELPGGLFHGGVFPWPVLPRARSSWLLTFWQGWPGEIPHEASLAPCGNMSCLGRRQGIDPATHAPHAASAGRPLNVAPIS